MNARSSSCVKSSLRASSMTLPLLEDGAPRCRWNAGRYLTAAEAAERVSIFAQSVTFPATRGMIPAMSGMAGNGVAGHFARQIKKERLAHGWSLAELGRRTGLDPAHLGRVESSHR